MARIKIILNEPFTGINSGWPIRYIGLIKELTRRHDVGIFAPGDTGLLTNYFPDSFICHSSSDKPYIPHFSALNYAWSFLSPKRGEIFLPAFRYYPRFHELLKSNLDHFDLSLYFDHEAIIHYADVDPTDIKICDICDSILRHMYTPSIPDGRYADRVKRFLDALYVIRIKRTFFPADIVLLTITEKDAQYAAKALPKNRIFVVPNGIDMCPADADDLFLRRKYLSNKIVFLGYLDYEPNTTSVRYVTENLWPEISRKHPKTTFCILGKNAPAALRNELQTIAGVEFIGEVENAAPYLQEAKMFVAPMFSGGGMKNKFLESLRCGTPVITNAEGAEGIDFSSGKQCIIGETSQELIGAINHLLCAQEEEYFSFVRESIKLARHYSWTASGDRLLGIIDTLLDSKG